MLSLVSVTLALLDPARNRAREYRIDVSCDLFGSWTVEITFGRLGAAGRRLVGVVQDERAAQRAMLRALRRRRTAPRRLGAPYVLLELAAELPGWSETIAAALKAPVPSLTTASGGVLQH